MIALHRRRFETLLVDESLHLDESLIDRDEWLAWGREHLRPDEFVRMARAVEADAAADRWPWRVRVDSLLEPEDHAEMVESLVRLVEAFDLVGAVA